ncbi:MAG: hypothetical protein IPL51_08935 [Candidatus Competibacteraceae bacterium]|nr:hypothetical protein [Candidatus Competibacteraceae bacterium]
MKIVLLYTWVLGLSIKSYAGVGIRTGIGGVIDHIIANNAACVTTAVHSKADTPITVDDQIFSTVLLAEPFQKWTANSAMESFGLMMFRNVLFRTIQFLVLCASIPLM